MTQPAPQPVDQELDDEPDVVTSDDLAELTVLVVDLMSPHTTGLAEAIRATGATATIIPEQDALEWRAKNECGAMVFSGGTQRFGERDPLDTRLFWNGPDSEAETCAEEVPTLFIGFGLRALVHFLIGDRGIQFTARPRSFNEARINVLHDRPSILFAGVEDRIIPVRLSASDLVTRPPRHFRTVARIEAGGSIAAIEDPLAGMYGVDFLPHLINGSVGDAILRNFLTEACMFNGTDFPEAEVEATNKQRRADHPRAPGPRWRRNR